MTKRDEKRERKRSYMRHVGRTLATLGVLLLMAVALGLGSEILRRETQTGEINLAYSSFTATGTLVLRSLQAALPVAGVLVALPLLIASFVHDLHRTSGINEAHDRLNHLLFGALGIRSRLRVREGKIAAGKNSVVDRVGGPAALTVYDDSAVVTERCGRLSRVLGTGKYSLEPYEKIWETVDLRQQRWVRQVFALTKEGLPVCCDVDTIFQIDTSEDMEEAVLRAATSAWRCQEDGDSRKMDWTERVAALVEDALRDVFATYRLDWLIKKQPSEPSHPRDEIRKALRERLKPQLRDLGVQLLRVDLGEIRVSIQAEDGSQGEDVSETLSKIISDQWIDAWHANWMARALSSRAEGEAELLRMDAVRIEAEAEMLIGLAELLQPVLANKPTSEPYVLAWRLVESLRLMSYDPRTREYIPPEAMRMLQKLEQLVDGEASGSEQETPPQGGSEA